MASAGFLVAARKQAWGALPERLRATAGLRALGFFKIPLIFLLRPTVVALEGDRCEIRLPLSRISRNHLGSMYFGALCVGADCAGGLLAWKLIDESGKKISLIFKDFKAEFLKRPEADVHFILENGSDVRDLVRRAATSPERVETPVRILATCPKKFGSEPVARFTLSLSLKQK
jgi:acyl-coenzyme A thioesterase PaaI-like protein